MGSNSRHLQDFVWWAGLIVGGGGFIFGYDIGVISGTLSTLNDQFNLTFYEEGTVVSILYAGSILGCLVGGPLCDKLGRWKTIHLQNAVFVIGALVTASAWNFGMLVLGRFLVGVASALSGLADVPYLTEIAPSHSRGWLSGQYEILVAAGILASFCLDLLFSLFDDGWRWAFAIPGALAIIQSACMYRLPESPKWLVSQGRLAEARNALEVMHGAEVLSAAESEYRLAGGDPSHPRNWPEDIAAYLLARPRTPSTDRPMSRCSMLAESLYGTPDEKLDLHEYYYAIVVVLALQSWSQLSGANVVRNYAPTIFEDSGASHTASLLFNIALGIVKFVCTLFSVHRIESQGRLMNLTGGILLVTVGMITLTCSTDFLPLFIVGCVLIYSGFGLGYGPIPWVLSAEVVPTLIRARVVSHSLLASNLAQLVTNLAFLPMVKGLGAAGCFAVFVVLNLLSLAYTRLFVVETRALSPNDIRQRLLDQYDQADQALRGRGSLWAALMGSSCTLGEALPEHSHSMAGSNTEMRNPLQQAP